MARVVFETPGRMNLLGYFLRSMTERNLKSEKGLRAFSQLKGAILLGASDMRVTLRFVGGDLIVSLGDQGKTDAGVCGSLDALLGVALGRELIAPVLSGKLRVSGKVWRILPLLSFLRAEP
jgi:hypothetical protein